MLAITVELNGILTISYCLSVGFLLRLIRDSFWSR